MHYLFSHRTSNLFVSVDAESMGEARNKLDVNAERLVGVALTPNECLSQFEMVAASDYLRMYADNTRYIYKDGSC